MFLNFNFSQVPPVSYFIFLSAGTRGRGRKVTFSFFTVTRIITVGFDTFRTFFLLDVVSRNIFLLLLCIEDALVLEILKDLLSGLHRAIGGPGLGEIEGLLRPIPVAGARGRGPGVVHLLPADRQLVDGCLEGAAEAGLCLSEPRVPGAWGRGGSGGLFDLLCVVMMGVVT